MPPDSTAVPLLLFWSGSISHWFMFPIATLSRYTVELDCPSQFRSFCSDFMVSATKNHSRFFTGYGITAFSRILFCPACGCCKTDKCSL